MGRPWSPLSVRLAFWKGMDEGLPTSVAARAVGVSQATAYRSFGEDRQVLPLPFQSFAVMRPGSLSLRERNEIGFQLARGQAVRQIAGLRARAPSTISREVARNRVYDKYVPSSAQEQTWVRARRPRPRKLDGLAFRRTRGTRAAAQEPGNRHAAVNRRHRIKRCFSSQPSVRRKRRDHPRGARFHRIRPGRHARRFDDNATSCAAPSFAEAAHRDRQ